MHPRWKKVTMERYQEVMVVLSESVMWKSVKRPLAEKSRWCHIRLAIKPRYLGNYASQLKSYYGTLWGSHGRSFRICHEKSPEAPAGGEITMTSYLLGNKTSLSRKPGIPDEKLLIKETMHPIEKVTMERYQEIMVALSESVMWNSVREIWRRNHDNVISGWQ